MKKRLLSLLLVLVMCLSLMPTVAFAEGTPLAELRLYSDTTTVTAGALPEFTASTSTEHVSVEESHWVKRSSSSDWEGFGGATRTAVNDGVTHYGLCFCVEVESGYCLDSNTKLYFNDVEIANDIYSLSSWSWGGYVNVDLGTAIGEVVLHNVTFDTKGGSSGYTDIVSDGEKVTRPAANPTRDGYTFGGWYTDSTCTTAFDFDTPITDSIVLYAKWTKNTETITKIEITAPTPVVGKTRAEANKIPTVTSTPANAIVISDGDWWNDTDGNYMTGTFEVGKTYSYGVYINPKDGYQFEMDGDKYLGNIVVTNGTVDCTEANGHGGFFLSVFVKCEETRTPISNISMNFDAAPIAGKLPKDCLATPTVVTTPTGAVELVPDSIGWRNASGYSVSGAFEAGQGYYYVVCLKAKDGYRFDFDKNDNYTGTATVNGNSDIIAEMGAKADELWIWTWYDCKAAAQTDADVPAIDAPTIKMTRVSSDSYTGKAKISWSAVTGAAKYEVYRATEQDGEYKLLGTTTKTSYTNSGAPSGTTFYYKVRTVGKDGGYSAFSDIKSFTTTCDVPTIKMTRVSGKAKISWDAVTGAGKYEVYRATSKDGEYKLLGTTTKTSYTNSGAPNGTTFYYKVKAISADSKYANSAFSAIKSFTTSCDAPVIKLTRVSGKAKISWSAITGASKYEVYRATEKDGEYKLLGTTTKTTYSNSGAPSGTTFYYKVKAISADSKYANSAFSTVKSFTTTCATPTVTIKLSSGHPKLSWEAVTGAEKYEVYRATSKDGTYKLLGTTTKTSYTNSGAAAGKTYYYKVKAISADSSYANSAYSSVKSIKAK